MSDLCWNLDYKSHDLSATKSETRREEGEERGGGGERRELSKTDATVIKW